MYLAEIIDTRLYVHLNISSVQYNAVNVRIMRSAHMKCFIPELVDIFK